MAWAVFDTAELPRQPRVEHPINMYLYQYVSISICIYTASVELEIHVDTAELPRRERERKRVSGLFKRETEHLCLCRERELSAEGLCLRQPQVLRYIYTTPKSKCPCSSQQRKGPGTKSISVIAKGVWYKINFSGLQLYRNQVRTNSDYRICTL